MNNDAQKLKAAGFDLVLPGNFSPQLRRQLLSSGASYIDLELWWAVHLKCEATERTKASGQPPGCSLGAGDQEALAAAAEEHVDSVKSDPGLAGFWILDDYPGGDISATLTRLHDVVHRAGASIGKDLPTICGLEGALDVRNSAKVRFQSQHALAERGMINVSPSSCDYVAPYPYGASAQANPELVDWSLRNVVPYTLHLLRAKGFRTSRVLIPIIHAFGNCNRPRVPGTNCDVSPRPRDILAQAKAWTDAGAVAMMFFTWRSEDADVSYSNDPEIRDGIQHAAAYFRAHHHY